MKIRWIILGLVISIFIHISIMIALGKIQLFIPSIDFIETFFVENKQKSESHPKITKKSEDERIDKNEKAEINEKKEVQEPLPINQEIQDSVQITESKVETPPPFVNNFIRFNNETMKFDIYWMGVYVGSAVMSVRGNDSETTITSEVKSAGFISNFYYVNDKAQSKIEYGKPKHFTLIQVEGKHRGNKETIFDYDKKEIIFINHLKNNTTFHTNIDRIFWDVLSGFFYLRSQPLDSKNNQSVDIFDSNKFATVQIQIIREEKIERYDKKEVDSIVIKPQMDTEGLFKRKGDILIWLSKDENKIPLKVETKVPVGKVTAELKEYRKD